MTTEQLADVEPAPTPAPKRARPKPQDHKPKAKKKAQPKVKTVEVKPAVIETDEAGEERVVSPAEYGRQVTIRGVTVTVPDKALGDFQTTDDLSLLGEAQDAGEDVSQELLAHALGRVSPLLRRLVGISGSQEILQLVRREHNGELMFGHVTEFIAELIDALSPNS